MARFVNSFEIEVPELTADLYDIDPQPVDDFPLLNTHAVNVANTVDGKAHWYNQDGRYFIAVLGADHQEDDPIRSEGGAQLTFDHEVDFDLTRWRDFKVLQRALTEELQWYLEEYQGYWFDSTRNTFYRDERETVIDGFDVHSGVRIRFGYHDSPLLTADPTVGSFGSRTLADYLSDEDWGLERVRRELIGETFLQLGTERRTCTLVGVFENTTVSETSPDPYDDSVIASIRDRHGEEWANRIDESEPTVQIRYGRSDWYPAAPSLLRFAPSEERPDEISQLATLSPRERWAKIEEFHDLIDHINIGTLHADLSEEPIRQGMGAYGYPVLTFGQDPATEMAIGRPNISFDRSDLTEEYWNPAKQGYLETVGPRKTYDESFDMVVFFGEGYHDDAVDTYHQVREYIEEYLGLVLSDRPGRVNYDDTRELEDWIRNSRRNVDAGFGYLPEHAEDPYHQLIDVLDGRPLQSLTEEKLRDARHTGNENDVISNTAVGLAVKLGVIPYTIENQLGTDAYLGLSVTGLDNTVASGVLISGDSNQILYQTEEQRPAGRSTVTKKGVAKEILVRAVQDATADPHSGFDQLGSLTIHRNGYLGDEEKVGIREGVDFLKSNDYVTDSFEWVGVDIQESHPHRVFDDDGMPRMGAYAQLDEETILIVTTDAPRLEQGTPQPLFCQIADSDGEFDMYSVGRDVFFLSELNWGAPSQGIKDPLTVYLTREMNRRLSHGSVSRLGYPPF